MDSYSSFQCGLKNRVRPNFEDGVTYVKFLYPSFFYFNLNIASDNGYTSVIVNVHKYIIRRDDTVFNNISRTIVTYVTLHVICIKDNDYKDEQITFEVREVETRKSYH